MIKVLSTTVIVLILILGVQVYSNLKVNNELDLAHFEIDTLEYRVDSIKGEMFILETEVTRYRIARETLEQENPRAAAEFDKYLSMTE